MRFRRFDRGEFVLSHWCRTSLTFCLVHVRPWQLTKPSGRQNLYNNITSMYPDANIWVIGHSLGGSLASLLGITFGAPVVTFEPPGERMAAQRLHLPTPVRHFPVLNLYMHFLTTFPAALNAPHYTRVAHGRPDRNGHLHRLTFDLRNSWVCDGEPVPPWEHHRI